jgi:V8-like Glu-specific endopeptidase
LNNKQIQVNSVDGEISRNISDDSFMTTAPIAGGSSGSPAFDKYGNLVGVMHAGVNGADNFNYAIYSYHLLDLMKKAKIVE